MDFVETTRNGDYVYKYFHSSILQKPSHFFLIKINVFCAVLNSKG